MYNKYDIMYLEVYQVFDLLLKDANYLFLNAPVGFYDHLECHMLFI